MKKCPDPRVEARRPEMARIADDNGAIVATRFTFGPAPAVEAMLKLRFWRVETGETRVYANIYDNNGHPRAAGDCLFSETNGDKALAVALAICRAWLGALKAAQTET